MEVIRYTAVGKEDLNLGIGTFEVRLADGRVVTLTKIDIGALLNDSSISTQALTLTSLILSSLTVSGTLTLGALSFTSTFDLTSGQIKFPSTQVPSSNPNTLDDYEEGVWTPSIGGTATYTTRTGTYIKIGRHVHIECQLTIGTIGTGSPTQITGAPYVANGIATGAVYVNAAVQSIVSAVVVLAASTITLDSLTGAGVTMSANDLMTSGTTVWFCMDYQTAA